MLLQQELELASLDTRRHEALARLLEKELQSLREEVKVAEQVYQGEPPYLTPPSLLPLSY